MYPCLSQCEHKMEWGVWTNLTGISQRRISDNEIPLAYISHVRCGRQTVENWPHSAHFNKGIIKSQSQPDVLLFKSQPTTPSPLWAHSGNSPKPEGSSEQGNSSAGGSYRSQLPLEWFLFFLNLPRLALWPRMWSILEKFPWALEKKVKFIVLGWNVL